MSIDQLDATLTDRTKALIFVSPRTRLAVPTARRGRGPSAWALDRIWVICDEIYEHLTFGDHVFSSCRRSVPELADPLRRAQRRGQATP